MATGQVLNFDEFRGYGFISSSAASEDIFMHVNDLLDDKSLLRPGVMVEFEVDSGERGPKASEVRILDRPAVAAQVPRRPVTSESAPRATGDEDLMCDVLSTKELRAELTEALLDTVPEMTAAQILRIRERVVRIASRHNWVES